MGIRLWSEGFCCALLMGALGVLPACDDESDGGEDGTPADGVPADGEPGDGEPGDGEPGDGEPGDGQPGDGSDGFDGGAPDGGDDDASVPAIADTWGVTSAGRLVLFSRTTGSVERAVSLTGLGAENVVGIDVRPATGALYVLTSASKLYTVDTDSGVATEAATLSVALSGTKFGVDFNPVADRLRVVGDDGQNLRINVTTGDTIVDTALNPAGHVVTAAAYTNSFGTACRTRLYVLDDDSMLLQDPPNDGKLTVIGSGLGVSVDELTAFEIITGSDGSNTAFLAATDDGKAWTADVDLATGAAGSPAEVDLDDGETLLGVTSAPPTSAPVQARGELLGVTTGNKLISFNRGAPGKLCTSAAITGLESGEDVWGADIRPATGALVALGSTSKLYTVDPATAAATLLSTLDTTLAGTEFAVGFNPVPDRLRVIGNGDKNYRINVDSGAVLTDGDITLATAELSGAAYTNSFAGTKSTTLFALDSAADTLVTVGGSPATGGACPGDLTNPNCGLATAVGALTVDTTDVNGFDIDAKTGAALAALTLSGDTTSTLHSINLSTGAATLPTGVANGTIGGGEALRALMFAAQPTVTAYGVDTNNQLLTFALTSPGAPSASVAITGMQAGEDAVGIDVRPADGKLYALGSTGRLYTVVPATGVATELSVLSADAADVSDPYTAFADTLYGLDFNPVVDRLRAVNDADQNLRIVPGSGVTITDGALNPGDPSVIAAAYTQNFAGTTATTLYVIDPSTDSLYTQNPPNNGTLVTVGAGLGVDATGDAGFDIVGGHDGLALAAVRTSGTGSSLYVISLATGAATPFNAADNVVGDGTAALRGLALDLK